MIRRTLLAILTLLLVLSGAAMLPARPALAVGSDVTPDLGPPGQTFTFTAEGFRARAILRVFYETPAGIVRYTDSQGIDVPVYADDAGRATWSYTTPLTSPDGDYTAVAASVTGETERRIRFLVRAGAQPTDFTLPAPTGNVSVRPGIGPPGTLFIFRSGGFTPFERVSIWLHSEQGSVSTLSTDIGGRAEHFANATGQLEWIVLTQANTEDGRYAAVAQGTESGQLRVAQFQVQRGVGADPPQPTDNMYVNPGSGPPGTSFQFVATGFLPNEGVALWIHRPDGAILTISADGRSVTANASGIANWRITARNDLADGVYTMVAQGITSTQVRVKRFAIRR
jgi:hypothetical protein